MLIGGVQSFVTALLAPSRAFVVVKPNLFLNLVLLGLPDVTVLSAQTEE